MKKIILGEEGLLSSGIAPGGYKFLGLSDGTLGLKTGATISTIGGGLKGTNYLFVPADGTDVENAQQLQEAYDLAKTMSPGPGNIMVIIASPGYYNFSTSVFEMDTQYIYLTSLDDSRSVIFNATINLLDTTEGSINITESRIYVKGVDVQTKNFTISDNLLIQIENCRGGDLSFGGAEFGDPELIVSGDFIDCEGGDLSFGGNGEATGTFINCQGGEESFGYLSSSGTFINCVAGDFSFGFAGFLDGQYENCKSGQGSFGSLGFVFDSNAKLCESDVLSFGYGSIIFDSVFDSCIGGFGSFGFDYDTLNQGRYYNCRLTDGLFTNPTSGGFVILGIDGDNNVQNITGV